MAAYGREQDAESFCLSVYSHNGAHCRVWSARVFVQTEARASSQALFIRRHRLVVFFFVCLFCFLFVCFLIPHAKATAQVCLVRGRTNKFHCFFPYKFFGFFLFFIKLLF